MTTNHRQTPKLVNAFAKNNTLSISHSLDSSDISHISTIHQRIAPTIRQPSLSINGPPPGWPASSNTTKNKNNLTKKSETNLCSPCQYIGRFMIDAFTCKLCCRDDAYNAQNVSKSRSSGVGLSGPLAAGSGNIKLLLIGLDNAGKTSLALHLSGESIEDVVSTIGFSNYELPIDRFLNLLEPNQTLTHQPLQNWRISLYDLGGGARIRQIWKNYYALVHGVVFVIDAADLEGRLDEVQGALESVLVDPLVSGKPFLIYLNKQDRPQTMDEIDFCKRFRVTALAVDNKCPLKMESISVRNVYFRSIFSPVNSGPHTHHEGDSHCLDPEIGKSFRWLLEHIIDKWSVLNPRVMADTEEQIKREKSLMSERLQRLKASKKKSFVDEQEAANGNGNIVQYEPKSSGLLVPPPLSPISERSSNLTNEDAYSANHSSSAQNIQDEESNFVDKQEDHKYDEKQENAEEVTERKGRRKWNDGRDDSGRNRKHDEESHISPEKLNRILRKEESLWDEHGKSEHSLNKAAMESMEGAIIPTPSASSVNRSARNNKIHPSP